jgi:hypothetical protein
VETEEMFLFESERRRNECAKVRAFISVLGYVESKVGRNPDKSAVSLALRVRKVNNNAVVISQL